MENKHIRIFVAFPIPSQISERYATYVSKFQNLFGVRWSKQGNLHLTLFFIGEVEHNNIVNVIDELKPIHDSWKSFILNFEKITFRGKAHSPGMIWAQFERSLEFAEVSSLLQSKTSKYMTTVPQHLDPIPHITLARLKKGAEISAIREDEFIMPAKLLIDKMELWKTVQSQEGVLYEKIPLE